MTGNFDPHELLHCPMMQPNDANAETVAEFLGAILTALWVEGECFSGKRPLGNSDWQWQVHMSLAKAGFVDTIINKWDEEDISDSDLDALDDLIIQAIRLITNHG